MKMTMKMTARARLTPWANISRTMSDDEAFDMSDRPCTCHPDDNPPVPCPQKYAYGECVTAAEHDNEGVVSVQANLLCSELDAAIDAAREKK